MTTATKTRSNAVAVTKPANAHAETRSTPAAAGSKPGTGLIVFGRDKDDRPIGATFPQDQVGLASKAAELMKLRTLNIVGSELIELSALLPAGRVYASGHGFVPIVPTTIYDQLDEIANRKAAPGLPTNWDSIDIGQLVIAQDDGPGKVGWYEAIVLAKDGDMLTVKWRDYPKQANAVRHAAALALLKPTAVTG